ncbi:MAG: bifunctional pyr operon transcriptional regulator/uracil phosphoribosyltransferase PyrR [Epulopiscium sp.]|nr:bifunctional pyr operon transcriptional regulator/uracil phosphoribosyltransferase PyrR [Candidatus Epulonipiscium sp.]
MKELMNEKDMARALTRISHEILEANKGARDLILVGIKTRGVPIAHMLAKKIREIEGIDVPVETVDITFYRDDLKKKADQPIYEEASFKTDITDRTIVLVDDVIFTGRTARSAMDAIMDYGRPNYIQLATLIDRGHRELPIRPDYVGKNIPTSRTENVHVMIKSLDGVDKVFIKAL